MRSGRDICKDNPRDFVDGRIGGTYLEYPSKEEVEHYMREVDYADRLAILSQGFRAGASYEYFYKIEKFARSLLRRKFNAPALGIRELKRDQVVPWIRDVIGDRDLAQAIDDVFEREDHMSTIVDEIRIITVLRMEQYDEVLSGFVDKY